MYLFLVYFIQSNIDSSHSGDASGTGSLRTEVYSALAQRVVMALLIPVGLHLSL